MPNLLTHYLFAKRFSLKVEEIHRQNPDYQSFLTNNFEYLALGTQGPDPLFYLTHCFIWASFPSMDFILRPL